MLEHDFPVVLAKIITEYVIIDTDAVVRALTVTTNNELRSRSRFAVSDLSKDLQKKGLTFLEGKGSIELYSAYRILKVFYTILYVISKYTYYQMPKTTLQF
jgi:hypothetical protein